MKKDLIVKMVILFFVTVGAVFWGLNFFFKNGQRSKASGETIAYSFLMSRATAAQEYHALVKAKSSATIMARGYSFTTKFDKSKLELKKIEYKLGSVSQGLGQTDSDLTGINSQGEVKLVGEINAALGSPMAAGTDVDLVDLTFKYIGTGLASGSLDKDTAVVYWYQENGTLVEIPALGPATFGIDGNGVTGSPTGIPTTKVTGEAGNNEVKLNVKLKFQGINSKPPNDALSSMLVKFTLYDETTNQNADYDIAGVTSDEKGIWSGISDLTVNTSHKFALLVKGPYHIQKKVCDQVPTETAGGTYRCSEGKITLSAGANGLDFSGILMLVGDLPEQDGVVDAYDISLVRNCIGKTSDECLTGADVNRDGKVDTQDYSLIIASLSVKNDEQ